MTHLSAGPCPRQLPSGLNFEVARDNALVQGVERSHQEAFSWDSSLVNEMRQEYFHSQHPSFNHENTHDFTEVFRHMIKTADLPSSAIYEITEAWSGQDEL